MNKWRTCRNWCCQDSRFIHIKYAEKARNALYITHGWALFSIAHHHFNVRSYHLVFRILYSVCILTSPKHLKMLVIVFGTILNSSRWVSFMSLTYHYNDKRITFVLACRCVYKWQKGGWWWMVKMRESENRKQTNNYS